MDADNLRNHLEWLSSITPW